MRASLTVASLGLAFSLSACGGAASRDALPVAVATPVVWAPQDVSESGARAPARNALGAPGAFAIVEEESGWLILAADVKDEVLASAPVDTPKPRPGLRVQEAKVKLAELGPEMRLEGRSFVLYRGAEKKCVVRAGAVRAVGFTMDHTMSDEGDAALPVPPEEIARELWSQSNTYVAAKVALGPECNGASWARLEELPEPRFAMARDPLAPVAESAAVAFKARPRWAEAQAQYVESMGSEPRAKTGTWEDLGYVTATELTAPFAGGSFVVRQSVWGEGCGANAGLTMVWRNTEGSLAPVFEADDRFSLEVAMDLDADGTLEMFGTEGDGPSLRPFWGTENDDSRQNAYLTHSYAFHGCRC